MIDRQDFYHGAALLKLVVDPRCKNVRPIHSGYLVNGKTFVLVKYSTRHNSPWRFTVTEDECSLLTGASTVPRNGYIVLVCGGDGFCAISWNKAKVLLGEIAGWLSAKRRFNGSYTVSGPCGTLNRKVPLNQWPMILIEEGV
jgi:hypothetical protein